MSIFFPHTVYAEDQPLPKTILTAHVVYRGAQTGATIGMITGSARALLLNRTALFASTNTGSVSSLAKRTASSSTKTIGRSAGRGFVVGAALLGAMLPFYMAGKEDIEWADRSWRLLENQGQVEVDSMSLAGSAAGLLSSVHGGVSAGSWTRVVGRTAIGNIVGVMGYMVWSYGVVQGQRTKQTM